jgi:nucleoside-diphosphate-sugar epimerase
MKILITGSTGFIGGHLLQEMSERGHSVTTLDRNPDNASNADRTVQGDIRDADAVMAATDGQEIVIHAAAVLGTAELINRAQYALDVNTGGTINVLDACREHGARLLFVSKPNPWLNTYSITKSAAESFCRMYNQEFGVPVTVVKAFNVYGPGEKVGPGRVAKAIPTLIVKALNGQDLSVHGDGMQTNDFVHVSDVVRILAELAETSDASYQEHEIGTGVERSLNELCELILRLSSSESKIVYVRPRSGESPGDRIKADIGSLERAIGMLSFRTLEHGLPETINYYRSWVSENPPDARN